MAGILSSSRAAPSKADLQDSGTVRAPRPARGSFAPFDWFTALIAVLALHVANPITWGRPLPTLWFPAAGVALCLVAWFGWRAVLLIFLDGLLVTAQAIFLEILSLGVRSSTELALIGADALLLPAEIGAAWFLYHSLGRGARAPADPRSAALFLVVIPAATLSVFAVFRAALYSSSGLASEPFGTVLVWFWLSRVLGVVVVAPPLLTALTPWLVRRGLAVEEPIDRARIEQRGNIGAEQVDRGGWLEIAGVALAAGLLSLLLASEFARRLLGGSQLGGLPLLLVVWGCVRQGARGGSIVASGAAALPLLVLSKLPLGDGATVLLQGTLIGQCGVGLLVASASRWIRFQEARYRQVVGRIPVVIYSARLRAADKQGRSPNVEVTLVSAASRILLDCQPEELLGDYTHWLHHVHPEDRELLQAALAQIARQHQPVICEYRLNEPDHSHVDSSSVNPPAAAPNFSARRSTVRWLRDTLAPRHDANGRCLGWEGMVVDITEQRALADDLRRTTTLFDALVANLPAGVFFVQGRRGRPMLVNARARQLLGRREDASARLEDLASLYHLHLPDGTIYPVEELPVVVAMRRGRSTMRDDIVVHRPDGRRVPLVTWAAPIDLGKSPEMNAAVWVLEDLTALHQAEAARRDTEVRLRAIIETMCEGLIVQDRKAIVVDCNLAVCALFSLPSEKLRGLPLFQSGQMLLREDGSQLAPEEYPAQVVLRTKRPVRNQILGLKPALARTEDTQSRSPSSLITRWLLVNAMPLGSDAQEPTGVVTTFSDITGYRQAQESVRSSEEQFRGLIEALPCMLIQTDMEQRIRYVNRAFQTVTGYSLEEVADAASWMKVIHPDDLPAAIALAQDAMQGKPGRMEFRYKARDGADKIGYAMAQPDWLGGKVNGATTTIVDVTRERMLEEKLQRGQRLELIGRLSSGIAHDFNNLLTIVLQLTSLARDNLPREHPVHEDLQRITEVSEQATQLTAQLLAISKQRPMSPVRIELNALVRRVLKILHSTLPNCIELVSKLAEEPFFIRADESQVQQVIMNLCLNARDAMPDGGKLLVQTEAATLVEAAGNWVHLTVQDDGMGMSDATRARIFEPFFSGKERGTGLGLTIVQQVVDNCGGRIEVTSQPNQGARFDIWLPWSEVDK
jgi:PAS domain S-box-containing protein